MPNLKLALFAIEKYAKTSIWCLELTLSLKEISKKLNNKKLLKILVARDLTFPPRRKKKCTGREGQILCY